MDNNTNSVGDKNTISTGTTNNQNLNDSSQVNSVPNVVNEVPVITNVVNDVPVITDVVSGDPVITNVQPNNQVDAANNNQPENSNVAGGGTSPSTDEPTIVNENLKKVEINYTPPSKFKMALTVFMFILIIGFVIFLPEITTAVENYKASRNAIEDEIITTGRLECDLKSNTANLDISYSRVFKFTDSKLNEAEFVITTRGDITLDEETLNDMANKCSLLKKYTNNISGVDVDCTHSEGKLRETQRYEYASIDIEELNAAFIESGGTYPEFRNEQDIDSVEKNMNAAGYSCMRKK